MGHFFKVLILIAIVSLITRDFNLFVIALGVEIFSLSEHQHRHHLTGRFRSIAVMFLGIATAIVAAFLR